MKKMKQTKCSATLENPNIFIQIVCREARDGEIFMWYKIAELRRIFVAGRKRKESDFPKKEKRFPQQKIICQIHLFVQLINF